MATCRSTTEGPILGVPWRCTAERKHKGDHRVVVSGIVVKRWKRAR